MKRKASVCVWDGRNRRWVGGWSSYLLEDALGLELGEEGSAGRIGIEVQESGDFLILLLAFEHVCLGWVGGLVGGWVGWRKRRRFD